MKGEVHASWVLEGRAMQNLFPAGRSENPGLLCKETGTVLHFEPTIGKPALGM